MDSRTEIINQVERRRRWSVGEKVALVEATMLPDASVASVADRHGVSRSLLFLWRKQAKAGVMPGVVPLVTPLTKPDAQVFAPVIVEPAVSSTISWKRTACVMRAAPAMRSLIWGRNCCASARRWSKGRKAAP